MTGSYSKESERIYTVFGRHGALLLIIISVLQKDTGSCMVATSRLYVTVSYGSCMVAASDLCSTVSYDGAVQTPSAVGVHTKQLVPSLEGKQK